jgi:hypothetical protein
MNSFASVLRLLGLALFVLPLAAVHGQAPPNDQFANATTINGPIATVTGSNVGATKQFGQEPFQVGGSFGGASVWWNWTATASGMTTIDTEGSDFDTILGVFIGNAPNQLQFVADNGNFEGNLWSRVMFDAVAGTTYRIYVDGLRIGGGGGGRALQGNIVLNVKGVGGLELSISNGMVFTVGDPIPITVNFTPDFPNPPALQVEFFHQSSPNLPPVRFDEVSMAPFTATATNVPAGSNTFYVVAFDSLGNPVESPQVTVLVQNVGVTILTPFEDSYYFSSTPIQVDAWAYLPAGTMTNVEFHLDGVKFADDDTPPYSGVIVGVPAGSHRLTAVGRSDTGARYVSQPVNIGVIAEIVPAGAVWNYLDNGSDQGTAWIAPDFNDASWNYGPAELGYGDGDEATVVEDNGTPGYNQGDNDRYITTYFRRTFEATNLASYAFIYLVVERDDAAVVYLNGVEVLRSPNLPAPPEPILYTTTATGQGLEDTTDFAFLNLTNFVEGTNVFAVEIHQQAPNSSDISFNLQLLGVPFIIHNLSPTVELTNPPANAYFVAPTEIPLEATAADGDGTVAKVEFFVDGVLIGEDTTEPYSIIWSNPPVAAHVLTAVATDDQGATTTSAEVPVVVYDMDGTPVAAITSPVDGFITPGPTNWLVTATANAITGVTNVVFLANGVEFGGDDTFPYAAIWAAPFGTNVLNAVAYDAGGVAGTSPPVTVVITIPPTNEIAPTIFTQVPLAGATLTNLTSITVVFSENVQNVDASDLLINGVPAASVNFSHSRSNYTFTFPRPEYGTVNVTWAMGHGIVDYGFPGSLPFDGTLPGETWSYELIDVAPPVLTARMPAPGSTVSNLTEISVTFSEQVSGVDATDLLLNGVAAQSVTGSGSNYVFSVRQPGSGTMNVSWTTNHEIFDLAVIPNAFNGASTNARWSFTLDTRYIYVQSNSVWRFVKGTNEASSPTNAWRQLAYDDSGWSNAPAPFFYGETSLTNANYRGTTLSDMQSNYTSVYLRQEFTVENRGNITNLLLFAQVDDGFIAWINGVQMLRVLVPNGELPYNAVATAQATEPQNNGAAWTAYNLPASAAALVDGRNVLAIHAFNQNLTNSSDFSVNAQLYTYLLDPTTVGPRLLESMPPPGDVLSLSNVTVTFSEGVTGVEAANLLVNGVPATGVSSDTNTTYTFSFPQPPYGPVLLTWDTNHAIFDFDNPPKRFSGGGTNSQIAYFLINPSNPKIATQTPLASSTVTGLTAITITFTEPVSGVDPSDLLVRGAPASTVASADGITYDFTFPQPAFGLVTVRWASNHAIVDVEAGNAFDPTRFGGQWNYTLIDPRPSVTITNPANNSFALEPATVTLRATASDNDGTIALVEFYEGATKLGEAASPPYALGVSNLAMGAYTFRAVATDNIGLSGTSAPVVLNVVTSLPITLVRGPYLQMGSPTGGVVRWRTQVPSDALVRYGPAPDSLTNLAIVTTRTNEAIVPVLGLEPDTLYYYSIGNAAQTLAGGTNPGGTNYWFRTSPVPGTRKPTRLWVLGDAGTAGNGAPDRQQSTRNAFYNFAATNGGDPDLWLMLGDNAYNSGTDTEHQAAVFDMYPDTLRNKFLWATIGNHETAMSTTATDFPYLHIFSLPTAGEVGGVPSGTEKYYSFDYGNIHFICLDSMTSGQTANTPMAAWLRNDLEAVTAEWIIVFFHHPPYTKGSHNSDTEQDLVNIRRNLVPILESNGVDLVLSGHSHCYERSILMHGHYGLGNTFSNVHQIDAGDGREDGDGAYQKNDAGQGTVYTVAGSSGQATFLQGDAPLPAMHVTLLELGSMIIDVDRNRLHARFLRENGLIQDEFTLIKADQRPAAPLGLVALPTGPSEIALSWTPGSSNHLGYLLERSTDGVNFLVLGAFAPEAVGALDSGLAIDTTYYYRLAATNDFGQGEYSNLAAATTGMPAEVPRAPVALAVSSDNGAERYRSQMVVRWQDRSTNEAGFQIERSVDGLTFVPAGTVGANVTFFLDQGLASATDYLYRVRAFNALGLSAPSGLAGDQTHPKGQLALAGETVVFHAGDEHAGAVTYQWRFINSNLTGQTNKTLVLAGVELADEGEYNVIIRDDEGRHVSNPAYLFVIAPPRILTQPLDIVGVVGTPGGLSVVVEGTDPITYRWRKNGVFLPAATGPVLAFPSLQFGDAGDYDVIVENDLGSVTSRLARVDVYSLPALAPVPEMVADVLSQLSFQVTALDANSPPLDLIFTLAPDASEGANIHPATGRFTWTPSRAQAATTNLITVQVVDANRPVLYNETTFSVIVRDYVEATAGSLVMLANTNGAVPLDFYSSAELESLECVLQLPAERFSNLSIEELAPALAGTTLVMTGPGTATVTFTALPGNTLQGTQQLARLHFFANDGQTSAFVPLVVSSVQSTRADEGLAPTHLANDGRITVIGTQPLLENRFSTNGQREVVVYGRPGVNYPVQYATNLANGGTWFPRGTASMGTNLVRVVPVGNTVPPISVRAVFYRARVP